MDLRLTIELIPLPCQRKNLRSLMGKDAWDTLRRQVYKQYNYRCAICNASNTTMYCHEIWQYEYDDNGVDAVQKLIGLIALCKMCHHCKHLRHASILSHEGELVYEQVVQHFMRVNQCTREEFEAEADEAYEIWQDRNECIWALDLGDYAYLVSTKDEATPIAKQKGLWNMNEQE